jgi:hypothetical protein
MSGPLEGIKAIELGLWVAGPSAAAILSDWGAVVVKIEPPEGDPFRGWTASILGSTAPINPPFEMDNRGKRSVVLNLENEEGRAIARQLIDDADVLVTNMRPRVLDQYAKTKDGVSIACWTLGEGKPLVHMMLGGFTHIQQEWQSQARGRSQVLLVDTRPAQAHNRGGRLGPLR